MFMIGAIYADTALRNKNANRLLDLLNKKTTDLIVPSPDKQVQGLFLFSIYLAIHFHLPQLLVYYLI